MSSNGSNSTMTVAEYAAHRGVSDSYIRRCRRKGNLVLTAGDRIDVLASDELLDGVTNPVRGGKRTEDESASGMPVTPIVPAGPVVITVNEAVRRERLARARLAELELGEEAKQLTRVEDVNRAVFTLVRQALNKMQGMSGRLRRVLAKESDPFAIADIIDSDVAEICKEMREAAGKLLKTTPPDADAIALAGAADDEDAADLPEEVGAE